MGRLVVLGLAGAVFSGVFFGCGPREHIRGDFGAATHAFFQRQKIFAEAAQGAPRGLDSEEAALIHGTYRKQLGGKTEAPKEPSTKVLLLEEDADNGKKTKAR